MRFEIAKIHKGDVVVFKNDSGQVFTGRVEDFDHVAIRVIWDTIPPSVIPTFSPAIIRIGNQVRMPDEIDDIANDFVCGLEREEIAAVVTTKSPETDDGPSCGLYEAVEEIASDHELPFDELWTLVIEKCVQRLKETN